LATGTRAGYSAAVDFMCARHAAASTWRVNIGYRTAM
jgi:hypothetical protein